MQEVRDVPACAEGVNSRELPPDCYESAATPRELFDKLDQWGFDTIVIPHGNTWGFYSPPGITWDKQLTGDDERSAASSCSSRSCPDTATPRSIATGTR